MNDLKRPFVVYGRVEKLKLDAGTSKTARFLVGGAAKSKVTEIGILPYTALPCYCPFLLYKLTVRLCETNGVFEVLRVWHCKPRFKDGIQRSEIERITHLPKLELPDVITSTDNFSELEKRTKKRLTALCLPALRTDIYYKLLPYFPNSFLERYTDAQLESIYTAATETPHLFCFRTLFFELVSKLDHPNKQTTDMADNSAAYSLHHWRYYFSPTSVAYYNSCLFWSCAMLRYFCQDQRIEKPPEYFDLVKRSLFSYIACERDYAGKLIYLFHMETYKINPDVLQFLVGQHIMIQTDRQTVTYPTVQSDSRRIVQLLNCLDVQVYDIPYIQDEMYNAALHHFKGSTIVCPHASNAQYMGIKLEKGIDFQQEKPKRGRKRKVAESESTPTGLKDTENGIYYLDQWSDVDRCATEQDVVLFNVQELSLAEMCNFIERTPNLKSLALVGNSKLWCQGIQPWFAFYCSIKSVPTIILPSYKTLFRKEDLLLNKSIKRKHDTYHNEQKLGEFLNEWLKDTEVKWNSKVVLFTNPQLMETVARLTYERMFKLGRPDVVYLESIVQVTKLGLYGVIKQVKQKDTQGVWIEIKDTAVPIMPHTRRYLLRVEDYYTKTMFTVDTEEYECRNPLFTLVKDTMCHPYKVVMLVIDDTTTLADIGRASHLAKEEFVIYYRREVDVSKVLERHAHTPEWPWARQIRANKNGEI